MITSWILQKTSFLNYYTFQLIPILKRGCDIVRAVVTGANRGIGLAITKVLLGRGDTVFAGVRKVEAESLKELKGRYGDRLGVMRLDVSSESSIREFAEGLADETVDVLFNNAGVLYKDDMNNLDYEKVLYTIRVNTLGPLFLTRYLLDNLKKSERPVVVNTDSVLGSITTYSGTTSYSYSISKAALNMVTRILANDLRRYRIIVISIHPGWVRTDMGGPAAPVLPEDSASGIVKVVDSLDIENTGKFYDYTGREVPW